MIAQPDKLCIVKGEICGCLPPAAPNVRFLVRFQNEFIGEWLVEKTEVWINGIAGLYFIMRGTVDWPDAAVLTAGQIAGSWLSAQVARRMPASAVRAFVIAVGCAMAASFFLRGR